jgi:hypothetical protein
MPKKAADKAEPRVAAIAFVPSPMVARATTTINLTGMPLSTPVQVNISPPGGGVTVRNVTTDGSGNASTTVVFAEHGPMSVNVTQATVITLASTSAQVSGHGEPGAEAEPEAEPEPEEEEEEEVDDGE